MVYALLVMTIFNPKSGVQLQIANVISWIMAVTFAYFINRIYVFESTNHNMLHEAVAFYSSRLTTLFMDMAVMFILVTCINMNDKLAKFIVQFVVMLANYFLSKLLVFKREVIEDGKIQ